MGPGVRCKGLEVEPLGYIVGYHNSFIWPSLFTIRNNIHKLIKVAPSLYKIAICIWSSQTIVLFIYVLAINIPAEHGHSLQISLGKTRNATTCLHGLKTSHVAAEIHHYTRL